MRRQACHRCSVEVRHRGYKRIAMSSIQALVKSPTMVAPCPQEVTSRQPGTAAFVVSHHTQTAVIFPTHTTVTIAGSRHSRNSHTVQPFSLPCHSRWHRCTQILRNCLSKELCAVKSSASFLLYMYVRTTWRDGSSAGMVGLSNPTIHVRTKGTVWPVQATCAVRCALPASATSRSNSYVISALRCLAPHPQSLCRESVHRAAASIRLQQQCCDSTTTQEPTLPINCSFTSCSCQCHTQAGL
ncbi:hypothetical protein BaRGS_00009074 [Batillaria attramentaria]|uniref:Uncharacterized protein n=1 Tax=Batillaria attramentaria TaxID=370345 RepID=A0ABD0LK06_9CAEN